MRYHYEKPNIYFTMYGKTYLRCNHPCMIDVHYI